MSSQTNNLITPPDNSPSSSLEPIHAGPKTRWKPTIPRGQTPRVFNLPISLSLGGMKPPMNRTTFLSLVIVLLLPGACHSAQKTDTSTIVGVIDNFQQRLEAEHLKDTTGSLSAIVFIGNKIVWSHAFGKADNEKGIDAGEHTVYRIGSISKTFTAYLMLLLVQDGTIRLDDPISKYLPEIKQLKRKERDTAEITFRELASHTAGLEREPGLPNAAAGPIGTWEMKVLNSIPTTDVDFPREKIFL
ncbi:serine hydrolase domain-containing protein [Puia sp. P3]|uniref:serine hydrolase domain-containing protein n=1 Tax=Puia sp. P3 TaxID=3423952 RepID=UPI003D677E1F